MSRSTTGEIAPGVGTVDGDDGLGRHAFDNEALAAVGELDSVLAAFGADIRSKVF